VRSMLGSGAPFREGDFFPKQRQICLLRTNNIEETKGFRG
jgi:hypothetical protein